MEDRQNDRMTDAELHAFFDRLFPNGFGSDGVLNEVAPQGWDQSPLLACFHPSVEQVFESPYNCTAKSRRSAGHGDVGDTSEPDPDQRPEPTLEEIRRRYQPEPVKVPEELTELIGLCLWGVFSNNHDVVAAGGRTVDVGSFRGASAFLDAHFTRGQDGWREGDHMQFYMGTIWLARRADLTPVYALIFRRLRAGGADWVYHFPQVFLAEFEPRDSDAGRSASYSVSESAVAELEAQRRRAEAARFRAEVDQVNVMAREDALDQPAPAVVRAYREVYGRDPLGWPPA